MSRLPTPGSDSGTWGSILNDFLAQVHNVDGSLKTDSVGSVALADNAVTNTTIVAGADIDQSKIHNLASDLAAKAPLANPTFTGTVTVPAPVNPTDASTKGYIDTTATSISADAAAAANSASDAAASVDTLTNLSANVDDLLSSALTDEDLSQSVIIDPGSITTARTQPILSALQNCTIEQADFAARTAVTASDTDYWTLEIWRYRAGAGSLVVSKNTKTVGSGGEGIAALTDWNYDTSSWGLRQYFKGDVFVVIATPTGSPAALNGLTMSLRLKPSAGGPVTIAADTFTRADSASSMGVAETGQTWTVPAGAGTMGIRSGAVYVPGTPGSLEKAYVETLTSDVAITLKIRALASGGSIGIIGRAIPTGAGTTFKASGFYMSMNALYWNDGTTQTSLGVFTPVVAAGDTTRLVMVGSLLTVFVDYGTTGTFVQKLQVTNANNQTATKHGIRTSSNTGGANEADDFLVTTP